MLGGNGDNNRINKFKGYISHSFLDDEKSKKDTSEKDSLYKNLSEEELKDKIIVKSTKVH